MSRDARSVYFPYCLVKLASGGWVVLNRDYKPLGGHPREFSDWEEIPLENRVKAVTENRCQKLSFDGDPSNDGRIYLYDDGCIPTSSPANMRAYLDRLAVLSKLKLIGDLRNCS